VGAEGKAAAAGAAEQLAANMAKKAEEEEARRKESKLVGHRPTADVWGEAGEGVELDADKVAAALRQAEERERGGVERDERKRGYNSLAGQEVEVTPEEMEAYRIKKSRGDDPLAFIDKEKAKAGGEGGYDYV
jgi:pre-mRNA-processing factor SLU7